MKKISLRSNFIYSFVLVLVAILFMGYVGDYFFDLNDDVFIKDLISGAYTGSPEACNMQLLYPLSLVVSLFYRVARGLDWYGIFLCSVQYLCVFLISMEALRKTDGHRQKLITALFILLFSLGTIGSHFLFVQYTFTAGFMSATAAFLILTHEKDADKNPEIALILIFVAYLLREEILLLTLPMVCVGILIRWLTSKDLSREFKDLFKFFLAMLVVIAIGRVANNFALSNSQWKEFMRLFEARTQLYDYQYVPEYKGNEAFYASIGLDESERDLLENYNFGIDEEINADVLDEVQKYAAGLKTADKPFSLRLQSKALLYLYNLRHFSYQEGYEYPMTDYPWNLIAIVFYLGVLLSYLIPRDKSTGKEKLKIAGLLALLFACRTTLWMFIMLRDRVPIRISHPLYLVEIMILLGMLINREKDTERKISRTMILAAFLCLLSVPNQKTVIEGELASRELMRSKYDALYDYFGRNKDNYYFVDVYTSVGVVCGDSENDIVDFSEKMFVNVDNSYQNHDIMGGWACKSPLYDKKMAKAGFEDMQTALLTDKAYFVRSKPIDAHELSDVNEESTAWLTNYYRDKGIEIAVEPKEIVGDAFVIYSVSEK